MPPERAKRQDPVSCSQCRKKKLKCDRQLPCTNCRSRDTQCAYSTRRAAVNVPSQHGAPLGSEIDLQDIYAENAAIKARLRTIENIVLFQQGGSVVSPPPTVSTTTAQSPSTAIQTPSSHFEDLNTWTGDSRWLENVGAENCTRIPTVANPINLCVTTLSKVVHQAAFIAPRDSRILIPTISEATRLFQIYSQRTDLLQHVLHRDSVIKNFCQLYRDIHAERPYRLGHAALFVTIMASTAESWAYGVHDNTLFATPRAAADTATYWLRAALEIVEQAWRSQDSDLATVQATILLIFLLYHTEAFSSKVRLLHTTAVFLAKSIGLHVTDNSANEKDAAKSREEIIELEIRRRVWWHLASSDWNIWSLSGGSHEGTYNISPNKIRTRKPRNISEEDLAVMPADFDRPLCEDTPMTYFLYCIRIGELCRKVADVTWDLSGSDFDAVSYTDTILPLDKEFVDLLAELPSFLSVGPSNECSATFSDPMTMRRYYLHLTIHARRCKLHLPFLIRAARDERYGVSRAICLQAARSTLRLRSCLPQSKTDSSMVGVHIRLLGALHHFFCAVVVLVMDLCVNRVAGQDEERKAEIQSACTIFENARQYSLSASRFLDALMAVMHKHKVRMQAQDRLVSSGALASSEPVLTECSTVQNQLQDSSGDAGPTLLSGQDFDNLWQGYFDMGTEIDPREWDTIFAQLDTTIQ